MGLYRVSSSCCCSQVGYLVNIRPLPAYSFFCHHVDFVVKTALLILLDDNIHESFTISNFETIPDMYMHQRYLA